MADYEYFGLRQAVLRNPLAALGRLEELAKRDTVRSELRKYFDDDIIAIYASKGKSFKGRNNYSNYKGILLIRGKLLGVSDYELKFEGSGGKTLQGIDFKGISWEMPIAELVDVVSFNDYVRNSNPYNISHPERLFGFSTLISDIPLGEFKAPELIGAYVKFAESFSASTFQSDVKFGAATPVKLTSIANISHSGTGTGKGFIM